MYDKPITDINSNGEATLLKSVKKKKKTVSTIPISCYLVLEALVRAIRQGKTEL